VTTNFLPRPAGAAPLVRRKPARQARASITNVTGGLRRQGSRNGPWPNPPVTIPTQDCVSGPSTVSFPRENLFCPLEKSPRLFCPGRCLLVERVPCTVVINQARRAKCPLRRVPTFPQSILRVTLRIRTHEAPGQAAIGYPKMVTVRQSNRSHVGTNRCAHDCTSCSQS
jgi:hypothetical protein